MVTSTLDLDEGGMRLTILAPTAAMLIAALAVPGAFGDDAVLFGAAYFFVRLLHLFLSILVAREDVARLGAILRFAPTAMLGASLLVLAGFLEGNTRIAVWPALRFRCPTTLKVLAWASYSESPGTRIGTMPID